MTPSRLPYEAIPTPVRELFETMIGGFEGGWQADPDDAGNWTGGAVGHGTLVGTFRGVTVLTFAAWRGLDPERVTRAAMETLTDRELIEIGYALYVRAPGFDRLPWTAFTAVFVDWGWGSGPFRAVRQMQMLLGVLPDGQIGPVTEQACAAFLERRGLKAAVDAAVDRRIAFSQATVRKDPSQAKFLNGWIRRYNAMRLP